MEKKWNKKWRHVRRRQSRWRVRSSLAHLRLTYWLESYSIYSTHSRLISTSICLQTSCGLISAKLTDKQTHVLQLTFKSTVQLQFKIDASVHVCYVHEVFWVISIKVKSLVNTRAGSVQSGLQWFTQRQEKNIPDKRRHMKFIFSVAVKTVGAWNLKALSNGRTDTLTHCKDLWGEMHGMIQM